VLPFDFQHSDIEPRRAGFFEFSCHYFKGVRCKKIICIEKSQVFTAAVLRTGIPGPGKPSILLRDATNSAIGQISLDSFGSVIGGSVIDDDYFEIGYGLG
jgi:hypothetical protein